ncbi:MAG: STAS domain-containing protein [Anaerolineae bacterium]|nr:STAS domain-containing protein [Anaerolineae bacterium]
MGISFAMEFLENNLYKVTLNGTLDAPGAMAIEEQFQAMLRERQDRVIIDLASLDYMSSYGLRMFLLAAKSLRDSGGGLVLSGPNPYVMEVIRLAGYDTMFPVYETVEDALLDLT